MPASPGDVRGADAAVPVAGEQAEAGPAASRRVRARGRLLREAVSWLTLAEMTWIDKNGKVCQIG